jgi:integrase
LDRRALKPQTQTVSVYTRHKAECPHVGQPHFRRCQCNKYIYLLKDSVTKSVSAKTRSWVVAEEKANAIRDSWDPVKLKLAELEGQAKVRDLEAMSIEAALDRWLAALRSKHDNEATMSKYVTAAKRIESWSRSKRLTRVVGLTPDNLDEWKCSWHPTADRLEDRIGKTTAARRLEIIKRFTKYCLRMGWISNDPAADFDPIEPDESVTLPLLSGRYEAVLASTHQYDEQMRPDDRFGPELRAIIELMRWSGLRIGDALKVKRGAFIGNRLLIAKTQKTGKPHIVLIPDHVVSALFSLAVRPTIDPAYFFWSGKSKAKSLTGQWQRKLGRLNDYLTLVDYEGMPLRFHSHQLRDTFAVTQLLSGTTMEDLSKMLSHASIRVTERYYAPWVPERQARLEQKMAEALGRMGAQVSLSAGTSSGAT